MIYLYSGTPGSGKSYHAVVDIVKKLGRRDKNRVIANFPLAGKKITDRSPAVYFFSCEVNLCNPTGRKT